MELPNNIKIENYLNLKNCKKVSIIKLNESKCILELEENLSVDDIKNIDRISKEYDYQTLTINIRNKKVSYFHRKGQKEIKL